MKTRLYTLLLTLLFCMLGFSAFGQKTIYIIDSEVVNFNGQQLKGKFIKNYIIQEIGTGKDATILHIITTNSELSKYNIALFGGNAKVNAEGYKIAKTSRDSSNLISMSIEDPDNPDKTIIIKHSGFNDTSKTAVFNITNLNPEQNIKYVVDGKLYNDISALKGIKPAEIRRIAIYKEGFAELLKYGKGFSVIVLDTKRQKSK
ncbi:MAG: hypothetical protein IKH89_00320 [Bacteroidales bacterium]|nr:hypothetical protein [Bacteroidales bacterium]